MYVCRCIYIYVFVNTYIYIYIFICIYIYTYVYIYIHVYMYVDKCGSLLGNLQYCSSLNLWVVGSVVKHGFLSTLDHPGSTVNVPRITLCVLVLDLPMLSGIPGGHNYCLSCTTVPPEECTYCLLLDVCGQKRYALTMEWQTYSNSIYIYIHIYIFNIS